MNHRFSLMSGSVFLLILSLGIPGHTQGQAVGTITGLIVEGETSRPVTGAQVSILGTGRGGLVNNDGRFLLIGVPAGEVSLRVQSIGYATQERMVTVPGGETVTVNFELTVEALGLDEIVVTGTAGGQRRRAIGNVVTTLDVATLLEVSQPATVQQMLSGQVPGANIRIGGGNIGSGGSIRIRGMSTMALASDPIIYIDGIRVDGGQTSISTGRGDTNISRLNDIDPDEIERIEVIKGPAASTLYGTEATNGVIQIITKRGRVGPPRVVATMQQGVNWLSRPETRFPDNWAYVDGEAIRQNLVVDEAARGNDLFRNGQIESYGVQVNGGLDRLNYFFSANYEDQVGHLFNNSLQRTNVRSNLGLIISDELEITTQVGLVRSEREYQQDAGRNIQRGIIRGLPANRDTEFRGFDRMPPEILRLIEQTESLNRAMTSATVTHRPTRWFSQRLTAGFDWSDTEGVIFQPRLPEESPRWFGSSSVGTKDLSNARRLLQTADYNATASFDLTPRLNMATTVGAQYYSNGTTVAEAGGENFPTSAVSSVSAASVRTSTETFVENKTLGAYVQQTMGWQDRLFVTVGLRADANSAFGEDFTAAYYPKVSATWTLSDADFWNWDFAESFRVRTAWGQSGQQPDAFAALQTYSPATGPGDLPTVSPNNLGNPELKPEKGEELELGFDASFFNGRLTTEFTHYRQKTKDLIVAERVAPSDGFPGNRFVNIGQVNNTGYEIQLGVTPIRSGAATLDLTLSAGQNKNLLVDLAGREVQADTRGRWHHVEGEPLGSMGTKIIATAEWGGPNNTDLVNVTCKGSEEQNFQPMPCEDAPFHLFGSGEPSWTGSFRNLLTFANGLSLDLNWVFRVDSWKYSTDEWAREHRLRTTEMAVLRQQGLGDPIEQASLIQQDVERPFFERDDYIRLREIALSYALPTGWVEGWGLSGARVTVSGRNLFYAYVHPEYRQSDPEGKSLRRAPWPAWEQARLPGPQTIVTSFRVTF